MMSSNSEVAKHLAARISELTAHVVEKQLALILDEIERGVSSKRQPAQDNSELVERLELVSAWMRGRAASPPNPEGFLRGEEAVQEAIAALQNSGSKP